MIFLSLVFYPSLVLSKLTVQSESAHFMSDQYIRNLNLQHNTWKAGRNFDFDTTEEDIKMLLGDLDPTNLEKADTPNIKTDDPEWPSDDKIPETFDARSKWGKTCPRIAEILDQGHCGSCWAVSSSSAAKDRLCIASRGKIQTRSSGHNVAFCCHKCGYGCDGGYTALAWEFYQRHGLVSGGLFNSSEGCQPYLIQPCIHYINQPSNLPNCSSLPTEEFTCSTKCTNKDYKIPLRKDKKRNKSSYILKGEKNIQKDIMTYGPMAMSFVVYTDFVHYKSGVYQKNDDATTRGRHAVRVIGWGTENKVPYWLIANSWNAYWGDKGFFKILRGSNHCEIEQNGTGGVPRRYK